MAKQKEQKGKSSPSGTTASSHSAKHDPKRKILCQALGIEVSKDKQDVCFTIMDSERRVHVLVVKQFANTLSGMKQLVQFILKYLNAEMPFRVVLEATGTYHENVTFYLHGLGYKLSVILPNKSKNFAKSLNAKSKTDRSDAMILGQMGVERDLETWIPPDPNLLKIRGLHREKQSLQQDINKYKNQVKALRCGHNPNPDIIKRKEKLIRDAQKMIKQIEQNIADVLKSDEKLQKMVNYASSLFGVGVQTAVAVLSEANGFKLMRNKAQLESYAGYDVVLNDSGTSVHGKSRISKKGNSFIRCAMFWPAIVAVKKAGEVQDLYKRVLSRNPKHKMKALVAVQRKLLVLMYTLVKNETYYDPEYRKSKAAEQHPVELPAT